MALALAGVCAPAGAQAQAYQDRIIDGLRSDVVDEREAETYNEEGLLRSWSVELTSDQRSSAGVQTQSTGLRLGGYTDTLHYGSISGNLSLLQRGDTAGDASLVLRQIGMPFEGGWRADNALGNVNLPLLDLARNSQRITLTNPAMQGYTGTLRQGGDRVLIAAAGRAGAYSGYPVPGFRVTQGGYSLVGYGDAARQGDGYWQWGAMAANAGQVSSALSLTPAGAGILDAQAQYLGLKRHWAGDGAEVAERFLQANWVATRNTGTDIAGALNAPAGGMWAEGGWQSGAHRHTLGLFRLEPGLGWLDMPMANDLQGGYWRHAWRTRQWNIESGVEQLNSVSGANPQGWFATTSARYQYSSETSYGGTLNVRRYGVQAYGLQAFGQFGNALGRSRVQVDASSADTGEHLARLQFDHDWGSIQSWRMNTSVSTDRESRPSGDSQGFGAALNLDWSSGRLNYNQSLQGRWSNSLTQYSLIAGLSWRISQGWALQANAYAISGNNNSLNLAQSPLAVPAGTTVLTQDSGLFFMLRYDMSAGRVQVPLGGAVGAPAGGVAGILFLDENRSGRREASEIGAPNVTVVLDGRFAVQTDGQGRFEFPYVAAGVHVITVISDNLPLPWVLDKDGHTEVRVFPRDTRTVEIGAVRQP